MFFLIGSCPPIFSPLYKHSIRRLLSPSITDECGACRQPVALGEKSDSHNPWVVKTQLHVSSAVNDYCSADRSRDFQRMFVISMTAPQPLTILLLRSMIRNMNVSILLTCSIIAQCEAAKGRNRDQSQLLASHHTLNSQINIQSFPPGNPRRQRG